MNENLILYEPISQCVTLSGAAHKKGRHIEEADLGIIENAAVVVNTENSQIVWLGKSTDLPSHYRELETIFSAEGDVWLPELIDCHTHLIFAGSRHHDYALRCQGKTYQEIARAGGGILSTIKPTRAATLDELVAAAITKIDAFQKSGVGMLEIKSGYGLTLESEIKILECVRELQEKTSVELIPTFMPAHALPPEFAGRMADYVDAICKEWIPTIAEKSLAAFFDVFVEEGFFNVEDTRRMCLVAKEHGLQIKLHTDQFNDIGGTDLALELGALSCDHLDHISDANIKKFGTSNTVAVLLPGASIYTGTPYPPARKLIDAGARVALSTDYNPGTCPTKNLALMTTLACSQMKMTVPESIAAITYNAAAALGLENHWGSLEVGKQFRICQFRAESYEALPYSFGEME